MLNYATILATTGLGPTSTLSYKPSLMSLHEAYFYEITFTTETRSYYESEICPENNICTDTLTAGTSNCSGNFGGP